MERSVTEHRQSFGNFLAGALAFFYENTRSLFLWLPVLFASGIGLYFSLSREPPLWVAFCLASLAFSCLLLAYSKRRSALASDVMSFLRLCLISLGLISLGMLAGQLRTISVSSPVIDRPFNTDELIGVIEAKDTTRRGTLRLSLKIESIKGLEPAATPNRAVLLAYGLSRDDVSEGQTIKSAARLEPSYRPTHPGAYDPAFRDYYRGIGARGRMLGKADLVELDTVTTGQWLQRFRSRVSAAITSSITASSGPDGAWAMGPFATALLTGKRGVMDTELVSALRGAGLAHILAISGLHMALMTGAIFWLSRALMCLWPAFALKHPVKKYAAVIAIMGGGGYLALSGAPVSAERAFIMALVVFLAVIFDRRAVSLHNLMVAAMIILIFRPESLLSISFQMSFASVAALIAFYEAYRQKEYLFFKSQNMWQGMGKFFASILLTTLIATVATAPFVVYYFGTIPSYGLLANLLVMPIFTLITMPLALLGLILLPFGVGVFLFEVMGLSLSLISSIAGFVSGFKGASAVLPQIPLAALILFVLSGLWLVLWHGRARYVSAMLFVLAGLFMLSTDKPDVLISENGRLIGVKTDQGLALSEKGSSYVAKRWLQYFGDGVSVKTARSRAAIICDGQGCAAQVKLKNGKIKHISLVKDRSILWEECARADLLIVSDPVRVMPQTCSKPQLVISRLDLWKGGAHALSSLKNGGWRIETVSARQGQRPWNREWNFQKTR